MNISATSRLAKLLGSASLLTIANALAAHAQAVAQTEMAQTVPEEIPENVLITGSLIRGTVAVGVPVVNIGPMDFTTTGSLTTADLFKNIPQFNVGAGPGAGTIAAGRQEGGTRINLRQLDTGTAPRSLMMIDGVRYPPQDQGLCQIEPDVIPTIAIERIDLLLDGASATYGSDAIGGVFNIILRRAYDGAITQLGYKTGSGGNNQYFAAQVWGRTWDGGDITLSYEWHDQTNVKGTIDTKRYSFDFSPWGFDNRTPLASSIPGTISIGGLQAPDNAHYPANNGHNCTNCYAIPRGTGVNFPGGVGPTAPFSASTLDWTSFNIPENRGTNGTRNEFNPYSIADYSAGIKYTGGAVPFDQQLTKDISLYGEGFYGMRRARIFNQANQNQLASFTVPTWNPYYPTGGAPTNLRLNYHMSIESPPIASGGEVAQRYQVGLNIALPAEWAAQISYSETRDSNFLNVTGQVNKAAVSAALGWTLSPARAIGTAPSFGTWTKPANIPYLNLFCDPRFFQCNAQPTLNYINNFSRSDEAFWVNEKSIKADGPLFDLPGGSVKAAIGADYTSNRYIITLSQENPNNTTVDPQYDPQGRQVWAAFAQVNIPVFSDQNAIFGFRRLDFEASWRHDQYSDFGGTSNQKIGFNWAPIDDLTFRGGWGTSFRAPNFGENSLLVNAAWNGFGLPPAVFPNNNAIIISCDASGKPTPGSGSEKLFKAGFACGSQPGGMSFNGGAKGPNFSGWRDFANQDGQVLKPEQSLNWAFGVDYSPTMNILRGLNVAATWYSIKITSLLVGFGNPTTGRFSDGALGFAYLVPSDLHDAAGNALCPGMDATPQLCAPFEEMVAAAFAQPNNTIPPTAQTLIYWLNDGGTFNRGWQKNEGIDYNVSYDWDMGDWGAFNVGIAGTYYLHQLSVRIPGVGQPVDAYYDDLSPVGGVEQLGVSSTTRPRSLSRSRIGWSNASWDATLFMNYSGHFYHTQTAPPNVNFQCLTPGGTVGGGTFRCANSTYNNSIPSYYTFDLSVGYNTGDLPVNDYLKNVSLQLTIENLLDKSPPFEYRVSTGGGNPSAFDILKNIYGRMVGLRLTKTW
jgi:iron complex outermembrane receptor protein